MKGECFECDVPGMTLQKEKEKHKFTQVYRSIPETLFETLTNLLYSVQKHLSVRTFIIQKKPVKWFAVQNSRPVSKLSPFLWKVFLDRH